MKKLLLIALVSVGTATFAQVDKGDFNATANISFQSQKFDGASDALTNMIVNLRAGYYFTKNVEAGASLMLIGTGAGGTTTTGTGVGPYVVYNFLTSGAKMLPYLGANFYNYNTGISGVDPINQIGGMGGLKYFLTQAVNVDTNLTYTSFLGDFKGSSIRLNIGIGINFGKLK